MRRLALVIGIAAYDCDPLPNAVRDAERVSSVLTLRGFDCRTLLDTDAENLDEALSEFEQTPGGDDISLIYFAGHGLEQYGSGYILPRDFPFPISSPKLRQRAVPIARLAEALSKKSGSRILVLDACRDIVPLNRDDIIEVARQIDGYRAQEAEWRDIMFLYSTSSGDKAWEGATETNSVFCAAFCEAVTMHNLSLEECAQFIGRKTIERSVRRQRPWYYSSLKTRETFSDLRPFQVLMSRTTPLSSDFPLSMSEAHEPTDVFVSGGLTSVWAVGPGTFARVRAPKPRARLVAARPFSDGIALIDENGELSVGAGEQSWSIQTGTSRPFGLFVCETGQIVVHGSEGWGIYSIKNGALTQDTFRRTKWAVHAGASVSRDTFWLGGALGHRVSVNPLRETPRARSHSLLSHNINTVSRTQDGYVLFGGDGGYLVKAHPSTGVVITPYMRGGKVTTMSRRRQSLENRINDDDRILRYLVAPGTMDARIVKILDDQIHPSNILAADMAPSLPIIAAGTNEGIIELIDARDNQIFQTIDLEAGVGTAVQGLRFISDTMFATLSNKGTVRFHVSEYADVLYNGPFLVSEDEDKGLIRSGLD